MSYETAEWIRINSNIGGAYSGGYVDNTQTYYLDQAFSPFMRNARLDGNSTKIRPGHLTIATLTAWDYPRGISSYLRSDGDNTLVVRHNQSGTEKLVRIDPDTLTTTPITTGALIASDNRMTFSNVWDVVYCMNGSDDFGKLDDTTYTTPSTWLTNFAPAFAVVFNSSHWAAWWPDNPNVLYKSVADDYEDFSWPGSDTFTFKEQITALSATNEILTIFTQNTISSIGKTDIQESGGTISFFTRTIDVKEWATSNCAVVSIGMNTYYLTRSNKIVQLRRWENIDGFETIELSERKYQGISNIMSALDKDQTDSFAYYVPKENLIKWFLKTEGATFNDLSIIYDITKDMFLIDEQKYFFDGINFDTRNYTVSNIEPKVFRDEFGQTDDNAPINFERRNEFYLWEATRKKILWEARYLVKINELAELTLEIYIDDQLVDTKVIDKDNINVPSWGIASLPIAEFAVWEPLEEGDNIAVDSDLEEVCVLRTKGNLNRKGKKMTFRAFNSTLAGKVLLEDLSVKVEILPELANDLTL